MDSSGELQKILEGQEQRSLFISDTHLFHEKNGAFDAQAAMLAQQNYAQLYLVGDVIDYEHLFLKLKEKRGNSPDKKQLASFVHVLKELGSPEFEGHLRFWDAVMARKAQGVKVFMITGNHDSNLNALHGVSIEGISFHDHMIVPFNGEKTYISHGDECDAGAASNYQSGKYAFGDAILNTSLMVDHALMRTSKSLGMHSGKYTYPLSGFFNRLLGAFHIPEFRENIAAKATSMGAVSSVTGHVHQADIAAIRCREDLLRQNGLENTAFRGMVPNRHQLEHTFVYRNIGDGMTSGTGLLYTGNPEKEGVDGWVVLRRKDVKPDQSFDSKSRNPYEKYRPQTLAFLQATWETFLQTANFDQVWSHYGCDAGADYRPELIQ